ncbi:MAG: vitamin K epoxide reductase family protein [Chloroflexota bacterium]
MKRFWQLVLVGLMWLAWVQPARAQTADVPVVRAVLFYSQSCGHCHYVITEVLPPLIAQYGSQFQLAGVDVGTEGGQALFGAALDKFGVESGGVPFLVIGDGYLFGSLDIPEKLPGLIEQYLAEGGVDWPDIPGLVEAMTASAPAATVTVEAATTPGMLLPAGVNDDAGSVFARDPVGNSLAVVVLLGMIASAVLAVLFFRRLPARTLSQPWAWAIPLLCLVGLGVAGYLAYVEMNQVAAVCGPVGDCNTVQQSEYARLFGILPIGVMGVFGYFLILLAWLVGRYSTGRPAALAALAFLGMSVFGLLFSIYLTFLEPFVIGATCAWCVTSAVLMTILFWLSLAPGKAALADVFPEKEYAVERSDSQGAF